MKRREFIAGLAGAAAWPATARRCKADRTHMNAFASRKPSYDSSM
jgi:hypothetical protein